MARRLSWMFAALSLFAAPAALAQEASATAPAGGFGSRGTIAITNDAYGDLGYLNVHGTSGFRLNLSPAVDYFVQDHLSLGAAMKFRVLSFNSNTDVLFGIEPRAGFEVRVNPNVSIWPRLGLEFDTSSPEFFADIASTTGGGVIFGIDADMPILYHASEHFFLGGGPVIHSEFTGDVKSNFVGLAFTVGGWM